MRKMRFTRPSFLFLELLGLIALRKLAQIGKLLRLETARVDRVRGQTAVEYLLLIALGIAIVVIGIAIAAQLKGFSDSVMTRTGIERNATIAMLVR